MTKNILLYLILAFSMSLLTACGGQTPESDTSNESEQHAEQTVTLSDDDLQDLGLETRSAASGTLEQTRSFPGEVRVNQDRFTHLVPRVKGIVESVSFSEGDNVVAGDVLAVFYSRELADIKSEYLASVERGHLAQSTFAREKRLFEQGISSESEFLDARQTVAEAQIELRSAFQKLLSLGFSESYISELSLQEDHALVHYQLIAPMSGMVLERHISQGESVADDTDAFAIADLGDVWIDLDIFQEQLDLVREGQAVKITSTSGNLHASGTIRFVRSTLGEETRTAVARIVLENENRRWRPGMFVNGEVVVEQSEVDVLVEWSAVIADDEHDVVFVRDGNEFAAREVVLGRSNDTHVEVLSGLSTGDMYLSKGAFTLKAEMGKTALSDDHSQ